MCIYSLLILTAEYYKLKCEKFEFYSTHDTTCNPNSWLKSNDNITLLNLK